MTRALIGASLHNSSVIVIRYEGDQSVEELEGNVVAWVSSISVAQMLAYGNVSGDKMVKG